MERNLVRAWGLEFGVLGFWLNLLYSSEMSAALMSKPMLGSSFCKAEYFKACLFPLTLIPNPHQLTFSNATAVIMF